MANTSTEAMGVPETDYDLPASIPFVAEHSGGELNNVHSHVVSTENI